MGKRKSIEEMKAEIASNRQYLKEMNREQWKIFKALIFNRAEGKRLLRESKERSPGDRPGPDLKTTGIFLLKVFKWAVIVTAVLVLLPYFMLAGLVIFFMSLVRRILGV